eukprot:176174-Rhodomonas_salina.1
MRLVRIWLILAASPTTAGTEGPSSSALISVTPRLSSGDMTATTLPATSRRSTVSALTTKVPRFEEAESRMSLTSPFSRCRAHASLRLSDAFLRCMSQ